MDEYQNLAKIVRLTRELEVHQSTLAKNENVLRRLESKAGEVRERIETSGEAAERLQDTIHDEMRERNIVRTTDALNGYVSALQNVRNGLTRGDRILRYVLADQEGWNEDRTSDLTNLAETVGVQTDTVTWEGAQSGIVLPRMNLLTISTGSPRIYREIGFIGASTTGFGVGTGLLHFLLQEYFSQRFLMQPENTPIEIGLGLGAIVLVLYGGGFLKDNLVRDPIFRTQEKLAFARGTLLHAAKYA